MQIVPVLLPERLLVAVDVIGAGQRQAAIELCLSPEAFDLLFPVLNGQVVTLFLSTVQRTREEEDTQVEYEY